MTKRKAKELKNFGARENIIAANPSAVIYNQEPEEGRPAQRARVDPNPLPPPPPPPQPNVPVRVVNMAQAMDVEGRQVALQPNPIPGDDELNQPAFNFAGLGPGQVPPVPAMRGNIGPFGGRGRNPYMYPGVMPIGRSRRRKRFSGFSRRSFKFLRWLYHNRKKKRFTAAQQQNALARRQVFFRAWEIARGAGRKYLTGADVKAAQGGATGFFSTRNSSV